MREYAVMLYNRARLLVDPDAKRAMLEKAANELRTLLNDLGAPHGPRSIIWDLNWAFHPYDSHGRAPVPPSNDVLQRFVEAALNWAHRHLNRLPRRH